MRGTDAYTVPNYDPARNWANTLNSTHYAQMDARIRIVLMHYGIALPADALVGTCALGQALLVHEWKFATFSDYRAMIIHYQHERS